MPADGTVEQILDALVTAEEHATTGFRAYEATYEGYDNIPEARPSTGYPFGWHIAVGGEFLKETAPGALGVVSPGTMMESTRIQAYLMIGPFNADASLTDLEAEADKWVRRAHTVYLKHYNLGGVCYSLTPVSWEKTVEELMDGPHYGLMFELVAVSRPQLELAAG